MAERALPAWATQIAGIAALFFVLHAESSTAWRLPPYGWGVIAGLVVPDLLRVAVAAHHHRRNGNGG